jgi:TolB-like protein
MQNHSKAIFIFILFLRLSFSQTSIAVLNLLPKNVSQGDASALTDRLAVELVRTGDFTVIERERLNEILDEQGFQMSGCTSNECVVEIGRLANVEQVVAGSVSRVGSVYSIAARMVNVESGQIEHIATFDYEGRIGELLKTGMGVVARELSGQETNAEVSQYESITRAQEPDRADYSENQRTSGQSTTRTQNINRPRSSIKIAKTWMGILGGGIASTAIGEDVRDDIAARPPGINGGIIFKYYITRSIILRTEAMYVQKGYAFPSSYYYYDADVRHFYDYFEIPFLAQIEVTNNQSSLGFFFNFGASVGSAVSTQYQVYDTNNDEEIDSGDLQGAAKEESSIIFGGGLIVGGMIFTEMRINVGLTPVMEADDWGQAFDVRNFGLSLLFGLQFAIQ